jgi:hypothetical protein
MEKYPSSSQATLDSGKSSALEMTGQLSGAPSGGQIAGFGRIPPHNLSRGGGDCYTSAKERYSE